MIIIIANVIIITVIVILTIANVIIITVIIINLITITYHLILRLSYWTVSSVQ